ncbi:MAG: FAD-dependent oxidoreductase [Parasporobacterium sp.]|nr:FAD-dependent oxidoreductase [Parasporobacterium sp.]
MKQMFKEEAREIEIFDECDILICGGGSAGHSAAIAAARAGAKNIILLERYGYMGGDVTGGYVIMVPHLSYKNLQYVRGIQEEWFQRLSKVPGGAVTGPEGDELGSTDPDAIYKWAPYWDCTSNCPDSPKRVVRSVYFEPNQLKIEMDKMLLEESEKIRVYCHCWACSPIMEGNTIKGVIFESKEGRKAILAKVVIDATGDGDIYSQAGATSSEEKEKDIDRNISAALVFRLGGIDFDRFFRHNMKHPEEFGKIVGGLKGFVEGNGIMPIPSERNDVCWLNNWIKPVDCINVKDLTHTEMMVRNNIRDIVGFLRENAEGFQDAYLYDIAPQLGARCSRRLVGEYVLDPMDFVTHREFDDVIAWHSTICRMNDSAPIEIPYRVLLPKEVENLLCPGRHASFSAVAFDWVGLIPQCIGTGQAAGIAAAVACDQKTTVRDVDIKRVQDILVEQDVPLPRRKDVDPIYTELLEENQYGLYTKLAKMAKEHPEEIFKYRQG